MKLKHLFGLKRKRGQSERQPIQFRAFPWLTDSSVDMIEAFIHRRHASGLPIRLLEFGAGASTIWFAKQSVDITTFEHDAEWQEAVVDEIRRSDLPVPDIRRYPRPYYCHIDRLPDAFFDIVLVDGRDRVECTRRAMSKLADGGLFVVDNTERLEVAGSPGPYSEIADLLSEWNRTDCEQFGPDRTGWTASHKPYDGRWMTTIWQR